MSFGVMWKYEFFSYYLVDYERGDGNYPYNYSDCVLTRLFLILHGFHFCIFSTSLEPYLFQGFILENTPK